MQETVAWIEDVIHHRSGPKQHTAISATKVVKARKDLFLKRSIEESHLVNVDGQGVVWAANLLKIPVPERVTGIDLMWELVAVSQKKGYRLYLLGATQNILDALINRIKAEYPKTVIAGAHHGYFSEMDAGNIAKKIAAANVDILFVGMPTPRKEVFIQKYLQEMNLHFAMGVGGSFDVLSGKIRRAPQWMQKSGLEWFFRLLQEPKRLFLRYTINNPIFIALVLKTYFQKILRGNS